MNDVQNKRCPIKKKMPPPTPFSRLPEKERYVDTSIETFEVERVKKVESRERERQTDTQTHRHTDPQTHTQAERQRDNDKDIDIEHRQRQ